jgi:hypothetical protein
MNIDALSVAIQEAYSRDEAGNCGKTLRLALLRGELLRVPRSARHLSVLSGRAWVSFGQDDLIVCRGESLSLGQRSRSPALVSALGDEALFVELV